VLVLSHAKRLRDADRRIGVAAAIAVLYALAVILFLLLVALITPFGDVAQTARPMMSSPCLCLSPR
jgi:hypothetical protein